MIKEVLNREPRLSESKIRSAVFGLQAEVLAGIYQEEINIAIWKRELIPNISHSANFVLTKNPNLKLAVTASPKNISKILEEAIGIEDDAIALIIDVKDIVDIFCCLFDVNQVGLRLVSLNHAMCPRFHVDNVPCRLLTTYCGNGTEWLNHDCVNREKLGPRSNGVPDDRSGLFKNNSDIQELCAGEIALLKGESWVGNESAGLVHRSPSLKTNESRLLLSVDFISR